MAGVPPKTVTGTFKAPSEMSVPPRKVRATLSNSKSASVGRSWTARKPESLFAGSPARREG
jgi:hypothetical protein